MEQGQRQKAEELLAKAVKACPVDLEARRSYAEALWQHNARQEGIAQLEEAARQAGDDATVQARLADMYLAMNQVEIARQHAEQAVSLNPKLMATWAVHGRVMRALARREEALADYHRSLRFAPDDRVILLEIAELYRELNQPERAIQTLQTLTDTYTPGEEPRQALYLSGMAYMALNRYGEAIDSFSAASLAGPPNADILCRLGEALWMSGKSAEAEAAAEQALACAPGHQPSRDLLGRIETARAGKPAVFR